MKTTFLFLAFTVGLSTSLSAQDKTIFQNKEGAAIKGYDVVAYFKENKAVKGNDQFTYEWKDAKWYFANKENLKTFRANPEKFAPQYGGYCAYGYSKGYAAPTIPEAFAVIDGKLYLNYNEQVQQIWKKDIPGYIIKADANYKAEKMKAAKN
ncbi:MAG: YHS domain-containing (seleno)protein [Pelobium sp.]